MIAPQPARGLPQRVVLEGRYARLEPLAVSHVSDLFASAAPERYRWLLEHKPASEADMRVWAEKRIAGGDPLVLAVIDRASGRAEGRQSLMRIEQEHGTIEIGGIVWGDRIARTRVTTRHCSSPHDMCSRNWATGASNGSAITATNPASGPPSASASPSKGCSDST